MTQLPNKMCGVIINAYGETEQLEYRENLPMPEIRASDVLIKVHAAGVNPVDWKVRKGYLEGMLNHNLPLTLGWDVAGEVVAIGKNVKDWAIGDAIYSRPNIERNGAYAQYIAIASDEIAQKPSSLNWVESAGVPLVALTAWQALYDAVKVTAGDKVLIHAGAGGVGSFAIQLAKLKGATVVVTCSQANAEFVKRIGADEVINYHEEDFSTRNDFDVVFDTVGGEVLAKSWGVLKPGGRLVSIINTPKEEVAKRFEVEAHFVFVQPSAKQLNQLAELIDGGEIDVLIDSQFSLKDAAKAHLKSETGHARGKIVLTVE